MSLLTLSKTFLRSQLICLVLWSSQCALKRCKLNQCQGTGQLCITPWHFLQTKFLYGSTEQCPIVVDFIMSVFGILTVSMLSLLSGCSYVGVLEWRLQASLWPLWPVFWIWSYNSKWNSTVVCVYILQIFFMIWASLMSVTNTVLNSAFTALTFLSQSTVQSGISNNIPIKINKPHHAFKSFLNMSFASARTNII